jgi:hypothetical protein
MSYGYSARVIKLNEIADEKHLGVALGRVCIALDIPVSIIALQTGVSRQTIYNWFTGSFEPRASYKPVVESIIQALDKQQ